MTVPIKAMSRTDWNKTPYAGTTASGTEGDISKLFAKYGCTDRAIAEYTNPDGGTAFCVRFKLKGRFYKLSLGTLAAYHTTPDRPDEAKTLAEEKAKAVPDREWDNLTDGGWDYSPEVL